MNLFFDLDKQALVSKLGSNSKISREESKQGDVRKISVTFISGRVVVAGPPGTVTEMIFVAKRSTGLTAPPLLLTNSWTYNGTLLRWEGVITQDHARLVDILSSTSTTSLLAEFSVTTTTVGPVSSQIFTVTLENDIWKGTEGTPLELPSPEEWIAERLAQSSQFAVLPYNAGNLTGTVVLNRNNGAFQEAALTGNLTLGVPSNGSKGKMLRLWLTASGSDRTLTLNASIKVPTNSGHVAPFTTILTSGKMSVLQLAHNGTDWVFLTLVGEY